MLVKEGRVDEEARFLRAKIIMTSVALQLSSEELLELQFLGILGEIVSALAIHQFIMSLYRRSKSTENNLKYFL